MCNTQGGSFSPMWRRALNEIRIELSRLFWRNGHEIVASGPLLVPRNDPTLMFTNAGMVQFKNVFTGVEKRDYARAPPRRRNACAPAASTTTSTMSATPRATTPSSRCSATSRSATTSRTWRSSCLEPGHQGIRARRKDRLLVTVYQDDEAFDLWKKIAGLPEDADHPHPDLDNFWAMGDTGPCGPCSEIFYDHGEGIPGGPPGSRRTRTATASSRSGTWSSCSTSSRRPTSASTCRKPSIDTGMGLERIAAVLQGKHDNYDIDLFRALIGASAELTGTDRRRQGAVEPPRDRRPPARRLS